MQARLTFTIYMYNEDSISVIMKIIVDIILKFNFLSLFIFNGVTNSRQGVNYWLKEILIILKY